MNETEMPPNYADWFNTTLVTLNNMTDDQRAQFFSDLRSNYCEECGSDRMPCHCENDD